MGMDALMTVLADNIGSLLQKVAHMLTLDSLLLRCVLPSRAPTPSALYSHLQVPNPRRLVELHGRPAVPLAGTRSSRTACRAALPY